MIVAFRSAKGSFCGAKADNPFRGAKGDYKTRERRNQKLQAGICLHNKLTSWKLIPREMNHGNAINEE